MSQSYVFQREFECDVRDLSVAFYQVAVKRYGEKAFSGVRMGLFQRSQPNFMSVKVDRNKTTPGIRGMVSIKKIPADFSVAEEAPVIAVFNVKDDHKKEVNDFLEAIKEHLDHHSIYRNKAIDSSGEFLDLSGVSLDDVVYNPKVARDLKAHVWTLITQSERCKKLKIRRSRKILFSGPYGSGKTLAAFLTAQIAIANGYTVFYVKPTDGNGIGILRYMIAFARRYPPAFVFVEDGEREQRDGNQYELGAIAVELDGLKSKNDNIIFVMTSNFPGKINGIMMRPGRIDKEIEFARFDADDMKRLLEKTIPPVMLSPELDWGKVTDACKEFSAAFVEEVGKAALLLTLSEDETDCTLVTADTLIEAANDLRRQHKRSNGKIGFNNSDTE